MTFNLIPIRVISNPSSLVCGRSTHHHPTRKHDENQRKQHEPHEVPGSAVADLDAEERVHERRCQRTDDTDCQRSAHDAHGSAVRRGGQDGDEYASLLRSSITSSHSKSK